MTIDSQTPRGGHADAIRPQATAVKPVISNLAQLSALDKIKNSVLINNGVLEITNNNPLSTTDEAALESFFKENNIAYDVRSGGGLVFTIGSEEGARVLAVTGINFHGANLLIRQNERLLAAEKEPVGRFRV